jgi:hypothetical protein
MKTRNYIYSKITFFLGLTLVTLSSCEREISDDFVLATFPATAAVFTDAPVGLTDEFFISFDPAVGANTEGFGTDDNEAFQGTSSIRIDVPSPSDPEGNFIGGIFRDRGEGRDLSGYDALTFWAKGTLTGTIEVGFGTDFISDTYPVSSRIQLATGWRKYTIPIPDPSLLTQEKGMFLFSAGSFDALGNDNVSDATSFSDNIGYTFWIDELKFEKLGNTKLLFPFILNGEDTEVDNFTGFTQTIDGLGATYNLANGQNVSVTASNAYFNFSSSNTSVATVTSSGEVSLIGSGTAKISATLANQQANGSLTLSSEGAFMSAPEPTEPAANVIAIYSDSYTGVTSLNPGIFAGENTGNISVQTIEDNSHLNYESIDFVGIGWDGSVDVNDKTMVHLDVQLTSENNANLIMELVDFGPDNDPANGLTSAGGDGTSGGNNISSQLVLGEWVSIDIPLSAFTLRTGGGGAGNPNRTNIGFVVFVSSNGTSFLVDNIYFY